MVATPIGNLRDITLRALDTLKSVDAIAAEDTRVSRKLLDHFGINAQLIAAHEHNEREASRRLLALLAQGKSVALTAALSRSQEINHLRSSSSDFLAPGLLAIHFEIAKQHAITSRSESKPLRM